MLARSSFEVIKPSTSPVGVRAFAIHSATRPPARQEPFPMNIAVRSAVRRLATLSVALTLSIPVWSAAPDQETSALHAPHRTRNVIIFVADGLRHGSVNPVDAPTLLAIREHGVTFANSHSLFPTFTMPNASAIATGHALGDTGVFSNTEYVGFPIWHLRRTPARSAR
jgi:hypothetical protein